MAEDKDLCQRNVLTYSMFSPFVSSLHYFDIIYRLILFQRENAFVLDVTILDVTIYQKLTKGSTFQVANGLFAGFSKNVNNIEIGKLSLTYS